MMVEIVRHGQTLLQAEHRYVGSTNDVLSAEGAIALKAAAHVPQLVYVSSLQRCLQTAEIVFPGAQTRVIAGLEEMDFGIFEGHTYKELKENPLYQQWLASSCKEPCPQGEGRSDFIERVSSAFARLLDGCLAREEQELTLVAHGGTIMAVMERFGRPKQEFFSWHIAHGCGVLLDASRWRTDRELHFRAHTNHLRKAF